MSFEQITSMPIAAIKVYLECMPGLKAEGKMAAFEAYATLWMDKGDKRTTLNIWQSEAFGEIKVKKATKNEMARIGIGTG